MDTSWSLQVGSRLLAHVIQAEDLSVRQQYRDDTSYRLPALDRFERHSDLISRLERPFAPASLDHVRGVAGLDDPVDDLAGLILDVELQPAMRVGPIPLGDCSGQLQPFASTEGRIAMMGEYGSRHQHAGQQHPQKSLHALLLRRHCKPTTS